MERENMDKDPRYSQSAVLDGSLRTRDAIGSFPLQFNTARKLAPSVPGMEV